MSCCGGSVTAQRQQRAQSQGLTRLDYATADPTESGPYWREDWRQLRIIVDGKTVDNKTIARASSAKGWVDLYGINVKTKQISVKDGVPVTKRLYGAVDIYGPVGYQLSIPNRDFAAGTQWWNR